MLLLPTVLKISQNLATVVVVVLAEETTYDTSALASRIMAMKIEMFILYVIVLCGVFLTSSVADFVTENVSPHEKLHKKVIKKSNLESLLVTDGTTNKDNGFKNGDQLVNFNKGWRVKRNFPQDQSKINNGLKHEIKILSHRLDDNIERVDGNAKRFLVLERNVTKTCKGLTEDIQLLQIHIKILQHNISELVTDLEEEKTARAYLMKNINALEEQLGRTVSLQSYEQLQQQVLELQKKTSVPTASPSVFTSSLQDAKQQISKLQETCLLKEEWNHYLQKCSNSEAPKANTNEIATCCRCSASYRHDTLTGNTEMRFTSSPVEKHITDHN